MFFVLFFLLLWSYVLEGNEKHCIKVCYYVRNLVVNVHYRNNDSVVFYQSQ